MNITNPLWRCVAADAQANRVVERHLITGAYRQRSIELREGEYNWLGFNE